MKEIYIICATRTQGIGAGIKRILWAVDSHKQAEIDIAKHKDDPEYVWEIEHITLYTNN